MADAESTGVALGSARPRLALPIPTLAGREPCLARLLAVLEPQVRAHADEVFIVLRKDDGGEPTGSKRNALLDEARLRGATHVAFIDDDDLVSSSYVSLHLPGVRDMYDCNSLRGLLYIDGRLDRPFEHSLRHTYWWEDEHCYYRNPNHLNVLRLDRIGDIRFPSLFRTEDRAFSQALARAGFLVTEYAVEEPTYYYECRSTPTRWKFWHRRHGNRG